MEVSGHAGASGWIGGHLQGPAILTGGAFGPEASIVAVAVCLVLATFYLRKMCRVDAGQWPSLRSGLDAKS
jgi:hypothetical protein